MARHPPLSSRPGRAGWAGGSRGAAKEEHLLLQRNASAARLRLATFARSRVSVYKWSLSVRRLEVPLLPHRLWPAGLWRMGKEGPALLLLSSALAGTQTPHVRCRRIVTSWPASHGWLSGPAGATLEGRLARFAGELEGPAGAARTDQLASGSERA